MASTYLDEIRAELQSDLQDASVRSDFLQIMHAQGTVSFFNAIYQACKAYGISKVAKEADISLEQVRSLREIGKDLPYDRVEKVLNVLGVYIRLSAVYAR